MNPYLSAFHQIASGRVIHAKQLAAAVRTARGQPASTFFPETLTSRVGGTGAEFLREVSAFFASEINRRGRVFSRGRKDCPDWFFAARRVADKLNGRRIICRVNECPVELRGRLAHRLHPDSE